MNGAQNNILPAFLRLMMTLKEGAECFRLAAEDAHSEEIHAFLDRLSRQRLQFAIELTATAGNLGTASMDRITTSDHPSHGFSDDQTLLSACERYVQDAASAYQQVLEVDTLPVKVRQVLERHAAEVAESAEKLRDLGERSRLLYHQML